MRHIALYRWNDGTSAEQIESALASVRAMRNKIPEIIRLECGPNLADDAAGYTHYVLVEVADRAAFTAYKRHPAHRAVREAIGPLLSGHLSLDTAP